MGKPAKAVAKSVSTAVTNVYKTIEQPVEKLVTQPSKLNLGDALVLGTAGLAAPTVNAVRHPGDIPTEAAIIGGTALAVGALTAPATVAAAPAAGGTVLTTSAPESAAAYSSSFVGSGGGGAGIGLYGASSPLDLNYVAPVLGATPGSPAAMGSTSFLSTVLSTSSNAAKSFLQPVFNGVVEVGKALAPSVGTAWLMSSLNKGNSDQPAAGDQSVYSYPPGSDPGVFTNPGGVYGSGAGYGPYGSSVPNPGTPGANDTTPSLIGVAGKSSSNVGFYLILFSVAFAGYWFLFRKRKFALA